MSSVTFQRQENVISTAKIIPDKDGFLIRQSKEFTSGAYKGQTKQFITVELTVVPKTLNAAGRTLRVGQQQAERVVINIWEHRNRIDFQDIIDNDLEKNGSFDDKAGDYVATKNQKGEYQMVEIDWAAEGAYYRMGCPTYKDSNSIERSSVGFYVPKTANLDDQSVMNHYRRACEAVGAKIQDDFAETTKADVEIANEANDQAQSQPSGRQTRRN